MAGESAREVARRAREKAERLQRHAEHYEKGADGEALTAQALSTLPPGWTVLHDVKWPGRRFANIDHIVVGPGGIFVVDSKNWSGRISVNDHQLRQNGRSREKAVVGCVDAAMAVAELSASFAPHVFPVLCFVGGDDLAGWNRDVMVCSDKNLTQALLSRPTVLNPEHVVEALLCLDMQLRSALSAPADSLPTPRGNRPAAPGWLPSTNPRVKKKRPRKRASLARPLVGLLMMLGLVLYGPQLSTVVGGFLSDQFIQNLAPGSRCSEAAGAKASPSAADRSANQRSRKAAKRAETRSASRQKQATQRPDPEAESIAC